MQKNPSRHPAQRYLENKVNNLQFFKTYYPGIFDYFSSYEMKNARVDILTETDEIDFIVEGKHVYGGRSKDYAKREVASFLTEYDYGSTIQSIAPLEKDTYKNPRFFAKSISKVYEAYYQKASVFEGYKLGNFFPLTVFMGIGLGRQIDILCNIRDIHHVVVFETDMDRFAASLYSVDWQKLVNPYLEDEAKSFTFLLIPESDDEQMQFAALWNQLIKLCPIFPVTCMFYNHLGNQQYDRITNKVNSDLYVHLFSFGNFDDELNQLNNALHNFRSKVKLFEKPAFDFNNVPVCIVGAGPSLDKRIDQLRQLSEHAVLISCGTALGALIKHGLVPDFQVELESDYTTYALHSQLDNHDLIKSVRLLGAAQLNPLLFTLFGESRLFFKDDGPLVHWFADLSLSVPNATPTCTNAALALISYIGCQKVFLFGLDYGFPDSTSHHAKGTVYYKESQKNHIQHKIDSEGLLRVPAAAGGTVETTTFLYTAKRRTDNLLQTMQNAQVSNCSDGVHLDNTIWRENYSELAGLQIGESSQKQQAINALFHNSNEPLPAAKLDLVNEDIMKQLKLFCSEIEDLLKHSSPTLAGYTEICSRTAHQLQCLEKDNCGLYYFIRGSVWHFLLAGYTHLLSLQSEEDQSSYFLKWLTVFKDFLAELPNKTNKVSYSELSVFEDDMVARPIYWTIAADSEDINQVEWTYTGVKIEKSRLVMEQNEWQYEGYGFDGEKYVRYEDLP